jgi:hypothetical protein
MPWQTRSVMATSGPKRVIAPEPPARLSDIVLPPAEVSTLWFRLSSRRHASPLYWSREGRYRFDSKDARWGVCYAATSIRAAFQEVFGDKIRHGAPLDWTEVSEVRVWRINTPSGLRGLDLFGEALSVIDATLQCFVSSYPKSQRWGAALMNHPADLDALVYLGRRSGAPCLAVFGDEDSPRWYQCALKTTALGDLVSWDDSWPLMDRLRVRITSMPSARKKETTWSLND